MTDSRVLSPGPHVLERRQVVARRLDEVFAFFAEPRNLALITPAWLAFRMIDDDPGDMAEGLRLRYRIRPLGVSQRWVSEITRWDPPRSFVDEQVRGPYARWHHEHVFTAVAGGTEVVDRVTYALPLGILGGMAHALLVRRQLRAIFDYREEAIREGLG